MATTDGRQLYGRVYLVSSSSTIDLDVTDSVQSITITESIFQSCVTCTILFLDSTEFVNKFPVVGYEGVRVEGIDGRNVNYTIHSIRDFKPLEGTKTGFSLCFISDQFILDRQLKVSQSYVDTTIDNMVGDISKTYLGIDIDIVESTKGRYSLIVPNRSPLDSINWLCGRALGLNTNSSNYFFYQTFSRGYIFSSLEHMIKLHPKPIEYRKVMTVNTPETKYDGKTFSKLEVNDRFDTLKGLHDGMYASSLMTHNLVDRKYEITKFNYSTEFGPNGNHEILGELSLLSEDDVGFNTMYDQKKYFIPSSQHSYEKDKYSIGRDRVLPIRSSQLSQINNNKISIKIDGDFDRYSGEIVDIGDVIERGRSDKKIRYSGKHYILGIKHMLTPQEHITIVQLAKDGFDRG